jgi:hypothetical protein
MSRTLHGTLVAALAIAACAGSPLEPGELSSVEAVVEALQQQGATVTRAGELPRSAHAYFSVNAQRVVVNGADVSVFAYPDVRRADADAALVSATGTRIGETSVFWIDTPNFYRRDRVIVLYVGRAPEVTKPLEAVMGPPFAGGAR